MLDHTALHLDARAGIFVEEVYGYVHLHHGLVVYAQEVSVHDVVLGRMTLQILENGLLLVFTDIDGQNMRVESFVLQCLFQILADQGQGLWILV
jgi:hypothetical protein